MTAATLLELLRVAGCDPAAVAGDRGPELEYLAPAPAGVAEFVPLLRTGVVAVLAGRRWFALTGTGHAVELNPRARLPRAATYLAAERRPGDPAPGVWDAVRPADSRDRPQCFDPPPSRPRPPGPTPTAAPTLIDAPPLDPAA